MASGAQVTGFEEASMSRPRKLGDESEHLILLRRMAAETGADTVTAFEDGELTSEDWAAALARCRGCDWVGGCRRWLDTPAERPRAVPRPCANAPLLAELRLPG
jgi:hypothetical protein